MNIDLITSINLYMIVPLFLIGSAFHFVYNWSKHNKKLVPFVAVNESYWEHMKIAFWPVAFLYLLEFIFGGYKMMSFVPAATVALYVVPISMVAIVFSYKRITKKNILALDISAFFVTILVAQFVFNMILTQLNANAFMVGISVIFLVFIVSAFVTYTKSPPSDSDIFKDPITDKYGIKGHK